MFEKALIPSIEIRGILRSSSNRYNYEALMEEMRDRQHQATLRAEWDWFNKRCVNANHVGYRKPRRFCTECCSKFMEELRKVAEG